MFPLFLCLSSLSSLSLYLSVHSLSLPFCRHRGQSYRLLLPSDDVSASPLTDDDIFGPDSGRESLSMDTLSPGRKRGGEWGKGKYERVEDEEDREKGGREEEEEEEESTGMYVGDMADRRLLRRPVEESIAAPLAPASIAPMFMLTSTPFAGTSIWKGEGNTGGSKPFTS